MTRVQIAKADLSAVEITGIMDLAENEDWQDWDIYEGEDFIVAELDEDDGSESLMHYLTEDLGIDEELIEVE